MTIVTLVMDELDGRVAARSCGLTVIGTLGLLELAAVRGKVEFQEVLVRLRGTGVPVVQWKRNLPHPANHPMVMKNQSATDLTAGNNSHIVLPAGMLAVSSGESPNPNYGVVRFTAPDDDEYSIRAQFTGIQFSGPYGGTTTDVHVLIDGSSVFSAEINGFSEFTKYTSSGPIPLSAGTTVDFLVGPGSNRNASSDWTGLSVVITAGPLFVTLRVSEVELCWNSVAGTAYQVQYRSEITAGWVDLGNPVIGDGSTLCIRDRLSPGEPQRFYRVIEQ